MMEKRYLGDGVYVSFDGHYVWLTTEDGISITNTIALDGDVMGALFDYVRDIRSLPEPLREERAKVDAAYAKYLEENEHSNES